MSESLSEIIRLEITVSGPMPFRRFMELALYHPTLGYYASGRARVGRKGDFFTNVSVGPLFGRLIARQIVEMWERLGSPREFSIIEQGAHDGQLAADVLGGLREFSSGCFGATIYRIVEPFPVLAERQKGRLLEFEQRVKWNLSLREVDVESGVHLSNELPDAFPIQLVAWLGGEWQERMVVERGGRFVFEDGPLTTPALREACAQIPIPLPDSYITEVNLAAREWIADVSRSIRRGFVLAVDYGFPREEYYAPWRASGTLSAYANHRREADPLARPGEIDLTAHVEFTSLIECANASGMRAVGFTDQHHFMVGLGSAHFADGANAPERRAFQTLMHPQFMGMAFKVVCLVKEADPATPLLGFRFSRTASARDDFPPGIG